MHIYNAPEAESRYWRATSRASSTSTASGLMEHDGHVGQLLKLLEDLKVADNTIVVYTTDNGAMCSWWPDAGATPFRVRRPPPGRAACAVPMPGALAGEDSRARSQRHSDARGHVHDAGCRCRYGDVRGKLKARDKVCHRRRRQFCALDQQRPLGP